MVKGMWLAVLFTLFLLALILSNLTGGLLWSWGPVQVSAGIVMFPVTFLITDVVHEHHGRRAALVLTLVGFGALVLASLYLQWAVGLKADPASPLSPQALAQVVRPFQFAMVASLAAYLVGQLSDVGVFALIGRLPLRGAPAVVARGVGSTLVSQLLDTVVFVWVLGGGNLPWRVALPVMVGNYGVKALVAVLTVPVLVGVHALWEKTRHKDETGGA